MAETYCYHSTLYPILLKSTPALVLYRPEVEIETEVEKVEVEVVIEKPQSLIEILDEKKRNEERNVKLDRILTMIDARYSMKYIKKIILEWGVDSEIELCEILKLYKNVLSLFKSKDYNLLEVSHVLGLGFDSLLKLGLTKELLIAPCEDMVWFNVPTLVNFMHVSMRDLNEKLFFNLDDLLRLNLSAQGIAMLLQTEFQVLYAMGLNREYFFYKLQFTGSEWKLIGLNGYEMKNGPLKIQDKDLTILTMRGRPDPKDGGKLKPWGTWTISELKHYYDYNIS